MADPTKYTRQFDYSAATLADLRSNLNPEFSTIVVSIDEIVEAIKDIRRSDGALNNEIVTEDSLHPDLLAKLVFEADVWTTSDFTQADIDNWNTAFGWGDHSTQGYLVFDQGLEVDAGGNARGLGAVDFQYTRAAATQVASGAASFLTPGVNNTASGANSAVIGGTGNTASGQYSVVMGTDSSASGSASVAAGAFCEAAGATSVAMGAGSVTVASAQYGVAMGRLAASNHSGAMVLADGATGTKTSSTTNELSLYFANGARLNGNALLDASDLIANGGTLIEFDDSLQVDTGGDSRGTAAVDLQATRSAATQVASGNYSAVLGGNGNTAFGNFSVAMVNNASAFGLASIAAGSSASTNAPYTLALGRSANAANTGAVVIADGVASGSHTSSADNELSLWFAGGARLNGSPLAVDGERAFTRFDYSAISGGDSLSVDVGNGPIQAVEVTSPTEITTTTLTVTGATGVYAEISLYVYNSDTTNPDAQDLSTYATAGYELPANTTVLFRILWDGTRAFLVRDGIEIAGDARP